MGTLEDARELLKKQRNEGNVQGFQETAKILTFA